MAHWTHYAIEAWALGSFMAVAGTVAVLLARVPASPVLHRLMFGSAMGLSAMAIVYSPWGRRSGAHFNPAITLTYHLLGKSERWDAVFYIIAQFLGGTIAFAIAARLLQPTIAKPGAHYVVTQPAVFGPFVAFIAEVVIAFILMTTVLHVSNSRLARFTGLCAGVLVAMYITLEAPLSGMSMNPARTFASAINAGDLTALWVYFIAPPLGMIAAAFAYIAMRGKKSVRCAKLDHPASGECIFRCGYRKPEERSYA